MGHPWMRAAVWLAAALPPLLLMGYIYREDKVEKEPPRLLAGLLLCGALSVLPAMAAELGGLWLVGKLPWPPHAKGAVACFAVIALAEEGFKYLALRRVSWRNRAFNYRFDAIVYAIFVSMGFALVENILYVAGAGTMRTAAMRAVTAIPAHAAFAVFMGYYYGCAKQYADAAARSESTVFSRELLAKSKVLLGRAVWVPVLLHGCYDFFLELQNELASLIFVAFLAALDILALRRARKSEKTDVMV